MGDELERAAELADKIADQPPRAPSGRHDDWCHGWQDGAMEVAAAIREMIEARHRTPSDLPQSADTLEDARTLALHYQAVAAEAGSRIMRLRIAMKIIREFGGFGNGFHAGVMMTMTRWMDAGMDGPVPWPESVFFDTWATAQGMSNVDGFVGYRLTVNLVRPDALRVRQMPPRGDG